MIGCDPNVNFGQPALKGRRLTVYDIVTKLYYENSIKLVTEDYSISLRDIKDAVEYCSTLECKIDPGRIHYCDGCVLRTIEEGWSFNRSEFKEYEKDNNKFVISDNGDVIFAGTLQELEDSEFGKVTWLIAEEVCSQFLK
jgi:uncharacterized protein (DUF433 family)